MLAEGRGVVADRCATETRRRAVELDGSGVLPSSCAIVPAGFLVMLQGRAGNSGGRSVVSDGRPLQPRVRGEVAVVDGEVLDSFEDVAIVVGFEDMGRHFF
ncbi:MAG TPA: hypothetical protein VNU46_10005 [Gemmatimonadaceae bacterium]|nr:hypothetical protein [Gemmatimonadaceae bacterium]